MKKAAEDGACFLLRITVISWPDSAVEPPNAIRYRQQLKGREGRAEGHAHFDCKNLNLTSITKFIPSGPKHALADK